jgi:hypothetical protein
MVVNRDEHSAENIARIGILHLAFGARHPNFIHHKEEEKGEGKKRPNRQFLSDASDTGPQKKARVSAVDTTSMGLTTTSRGRGRGRAQRSSSGASGGITFYDTGGDDPGGSDVAATSTTTSPMPSSLKRSASALSMSSVQSVMDDTREVDEREGGPKWKGKAKARKKGIWKGVKKLSK